VKGSKSLFILNGMKEHFPKYMLILGYLSLFLGSDRALGIPSLELGNNFQDETVSGQTGGSVNSKDCGAISSQPNQVIYVKERIDYMKLSVRANGGQPTLLIYGPTDRNRFCVLGDRASGFQPEISGVWEPGKYSIYVGDRSGSQHQFILHLYPRKKTP
jgi:hypothetical protein